MVGWVRGLDECVETLPRQLEGLRVDEPNTHLAVLDSLHATHTQTHKHHAMEDERYMAADQRVRQTTEYKNTEKNTQYYTTSPLLLTTGSQVPIIESLTDARIGIAQATRSSTAYTATNVHRTPLH
jgi:hypothetical protein